MNAENKSDHARFTNSVGDALRKALIVQGQSNQGRKLNDQKELNLKEERRNERSDLY